MPYLNAVLQNARTPDGATPASIMAEEHPRTVRVTCSEMYVLALPALLLTAGSLLLLLVLVLLLLLLLVVVVLLLLLLLLLACVGTCLLLCRLRARLLPAVGCRTTACGCSSRRVRVGTFKLAIGCDVHLCNARSVDISMYRVASQP